MWSESTPYSKRSARWLLVGAEVALSVVLVVCAGLLIRSFVRLENVDLGFRTGHTLSFRLDLGRFRSLREAESPSICRDREPAPRTARYRGDWSQARPVLGGGAGGEATVTIQGLERSLRLELVTPGYFLAMRTPLLRGRFPNQLDTQKSSLIAVVNSAFENVYFPDKNTVGKQIVFGRRRAGDHCRSCRRLETGGNRPACPASGFCPVDSNHPWGRDLFRARAR